MDAVVPVSVAGRMALRFEYDGLERLTRSTDGADGTLVDGDDWVNEDTGETPHTRHISSIG